MGSMIHFHGDPFPLERESLPRGCHDPERYLEIISDNGLLTELVHLGHRIDLTLIFNLMLCDRNGSPGSGLPPLPLQSPT